ncbi:Uncharacterised protein [Candidatus Norongarragalina meridionalis]|nr:Uncharacterised protein [Candidatus Norongarragalina meridionalis]
MKTNIFAFGILLVAAAFASATAVSCSGTFTMPIESGNYTSCAINELVSGAGGSAIITSNGVYCVKTTKFYTQAYQFSDHRINVKLLSGTTCAAWSPSDYCYNQMSVGGACNKDMVPGNNFIFGEPDNPSAPRVIYHYLWYINAYGSSLQPVFPFGMLYQNTIAMQLKSTKATPAIATAKVTKARSRR